MRTLEKYESDLKLQRGFLRKSLGKHMATALLAGAIIGSFKTEVPPQNDPRLAQGSKNIFYPKGDLVTLPMGAIIGYGIYRIRRSNEIRELKITKFGLRFRMVERLEQQLGQRKDREKES
jgi:hypothetical protein